MARARNIKPGIFTNEVLGVAPERISLLFIGLWMLADRDGRMEDRPLRIKASLFPLRGYPEIDGDLNWLQSNGFIDRYESNGLKLLWITKFRDHQRPHPNERQSMYGVSPLDNQGKKRGAPRRSHKENQGAKDFALNPSSLNPSSLIPESLLTECPFLAVLRTDRFARVWERWRKHRQEIGHPLTPEQEISQLKKLAAEGEDPACQRVEKSIQQGWRGLWFASESKQPASPSGNGQMPKKETTAERVRRLAGEGEQE